MKRDLPAHVYDKKGILYFQRRGYKSARIASRPGSKEFALEYAALLNGAQPAPPSGKTFSSLVTSYERSQRYRNLAPRTARDYDKVLAWVRKKLGPLPVDRMRRKDLIRARDANAEAVRFANYIVQVVRILLEHAIDIGWRDDNPAKGVSLLKSETPARQSWPPEKIDAFREHAGGRALLIFELCLGTGQRIGDVLKMRWSDIESDGINVTQGKTGTVLWVPFTAPLSTLISKTPKVGPTICAWGRGKPSSYRSAHELVMNVRKQIGAETYDLHGLRYAAAAELASLGCSDELIMAVTGHQTRAMVARYAGSARQVSRAKEAQKLRK
ncbi:tyrosine-type recombinase/integrase [Parasedimentitalea maritima]|uniref:Tyrosine-type recombinase/integrase n=1 Tax=Parasedimentitalea maritima TaxID=2578117 RepID=A0A6A4RF43_9RHOB|nr:tyrosine-type recombinase/integrase [Zongyanglinia marina]KAE9627957.1 tyrosine-type recombinase/integrase [Zongyanglinia marina]